MKKIIVIVSLLIVVAGSTQAQVFVGVNNSAGLEGTSNNAAGLTVAAGADIGFINTYVGTWGLFGSQSISLGTTGHTVIGVLHLPHDWRDRTAFLWGLGADLRSTVNTPYGQKTEESGTLRKSIGYRDKRGYGIALRAGVSFKFHLYLSGSLVLGGFDTYKDVYTMSHTPAGLHYDGYSVGDENHTYSTLSLSIGYRF
jgi:hypothetical protein